VIEVAAAAVSHIDRLEASRNVLHGSADDPLRCRNDGVGVLDGGRRVYFDTTIAPFGAMAERTLVPESALLDLADDVDDAVAATLGNAGLAAWLSLLWRARLARDETVLVLAATGAVGAAKLLGGRSCGRRGRSGRRLQRLRESSVPMRR
jgi:NADPH:quinone reductase-like Zn-dependent oxidoreductase